MVRCIIIIMLVGGSVQSRLHGSWLVRQRSIITLIITGIGIIRRNHSKVTSRVHGVRRTRVSLGMDQENLFLFASISAACHGGAGTSIGSYVGTRNASAGRSMIIAGLEADRVVGVLIAAIQHPLLPTDEQPAESTCHGLEEIPRIEGIENRFNAEWASVICHFTSTVKVRGVTSGVRLPGKCEDVQNRENGHFDRDQ